MLDSISELFFIKEREERYLIQYTVVDIQKDL